MSTQKAARAKLAELEKEGVKVEPIWGNDYTLTVDLDMLESRAEFPRRFAALLEHEPELHIVDQYQSRGADR